MFCEKQIMIRNPKSLGRPEPQSSVQENEKKGNKIPQFSTFYHFTVDFAFLQGFS